ncbi:MAG: cytochrome c [Saprospiraceae bacterium]
MNKFQFLFLAFIILSMSIMVSCSGDKSNKTPKAITPKAITKKAIDPMKDTGIGPVKELVLPAEIDETMVAAGKKIYKEKCTACHKAKKKFIGPSPKGIFERRNPAWVMNMILNPDEMVAKNELAKQLLIEYNGSPMANQNLTEKEARNIVEYFRTLK